MSGYMSARWHLIVAGVIAIFGYGVAACKLAGLSWDGSWYLFRSLQDGTPFIPHLRYGTYPILWLIVQASRIIHTPATLGICYGGLLSLFPLGALALSWWFLRREENAALRIWPTLGILLAALPGQFCLMSEATPAAQLFWPILAVIVTGPPGPAGGACLILLSGAAAFLHPTASFIFGSAAALFARQAWIRSPVSKSGWVWAGGFAAATVGEIILTLHSASEYERSQASLGEMGRQLHHSVSGFPLFLLLTTYLLGVLLLAAAGALGPLFAPEVWLIRTNVSGGRTTVPVAVETSSLATGTVALPPEPGAACSIKKCSRYIRPACAMLLIAVAGAGWYWASDPARWSGLLDYRRFVLPAMLPLVLMAARHHQHLGRTPQTIPPTFPWVLPWIAAVFSAVLITQSVVWQSLLERFTTEVSRRSSPQRSITAAELPFIRRTPLQHWTACPLSVLLQDRQPLRLFVLKPTDVQASSVQVNPWEEISLTDRWFKLRHLVQAPTEKPR